MKSGKLVDLFKRKKIWGISGTLKEQCHKDFAVLGQFLLLWDLIIKKMLLENYDEGIKWILSEKGNHNKFLEGFWNT